MKVDENDRLDFNCVLSGLNDTMSYIRKPLPVDMPIEKVQDYYDAIITVFAEFKVEEHKLRCKFSEKYNVNYDFNYKNGEIL